MVESKFYVFGGQANGEFFNDLWSFDLNSRKPFTRHQRNIMTDVNISANEGEMGARRAGSRGVSEAFQAHRPYLPGIRWQDCYV